MPPYLGKCRKRINRGSGLPLNPQIAYPPLLRTGVSEQREGEREPQGEAYRGEHRRSRVNGQRDRTGGGTAGWMGKD